MYRIVGSPNPQKSQRMTVPKLPSSLYFARWGYINAQLDHTSPPHFTPRPAHVFLFDGLGRRHRGRPETVGNGFCSILHQACIINQEVQDKSCTELYHGYATAVSRMLAPLKEHCNYATESPAGRNLGNAVVYRLRTIEERCVPLITEPNTTQPICRQFLVGPTYGPSALGVSSTDAMAGSSVDLKSHVLALRFQVTSHEPWRISLAITIYILISCPHYKQTSLHSPDNDKHGSST